MPKVSANLVCKVTSHLKSKTHNIALSDVLKKNYTFTSDVVVGDYAFGNRSSGDDVVAGYVRRRL
jgi:hypothetical protein